MFLVDLTSQVTVGEYCIVVSWLCFIRDVSVNIAGNV